MSDFKSKLDEHNRYNNAVVRDFIDNINIGVYPVTVTDSASAKLAAEWVEKQVKEHIDQKDTNT